MRTELWKVFFMVYKALQTKGEGSAIKGERPQADMELMLNKCHPGLIQDRQREGPEFG